jgi:ribosomal protein S17
MLLTSHRKHINIFAYITAKIRPSHPLSSKRRVVEKVANVKDAPLGETAAGKLIYIMKIRQSSIQNNWRVIEKMQFLML